MAEFAGLFPNAELVVQAGAGHFPWLDDADRFVATTEAFLGWATTSSPHLSGSGRLGRRRQLDGSSGRGPSSDRSCPEQNDAKLTAASQEVAVLAYLVAIQRKRLRVLKQRSTVLRRRWTSRSKPGGRPPPRPLLCRFRFWSVFSGMVWPLPRRRRCAESAGAVGPMGAVGRP
jgi:hypothetical protein